MVLDHMRLLCNHNPACFEYLADWLAHLLQKPGALSGVACLTVGDPGCGKTTFLE